MCWEDVLIGRNVRGGPRTIAISTSEFLVVGPSHKRHTLVIFPPTLGRLTLFPESGITALQGFVLEQTSDPLVLFVERHGGLVTDRIFGIGESIQGRVTDNWRVRATATNAITTATQAASADRTHYLTSALWSYGTNAITGRVEIEINDVVQYSDNITVAKEIGFPGGLVAANNQSIEATLAAGGAGVNGFVTIGGFTKESSGVGNVIIWEGILDGKPRDY